MFFLLEYHYGFLRTLPFIFLGKKEGKRELGGTINGSHPCGQNANSVVGPIITNVEVQALKFILIIKWYCFDKRLYGMVGKTYTTVWYKVASFNMNFAILKCILRREHLLIYE